MKPSSINTYPPPGDSSLKLKATRSPRRSYFEHEIVMETFHGLPGAESEQPFIRSPTANYTSNEGKNLTHSTLHRQEPCVQWHQSHAMAYQYPKLENSYQLSPSHDNVIQNDLFIREPNGDFASEYTLPHSYDSGVSVQSSAETGFNSEYLFNSLQQNFSNGFSDFDGLDNLILDSPADLERLRLSHSLIMENQTSTDSSSDFKGTPALVDTSSSKASDDGGDSGDGNLSTTEGRISEAPYAKLIYKALMEAPNHSMVLQDIYQWFIDNTGKGSSASIGWRNSIRHNLSMNAAFRKTSRQPNGDDSKRTSEWVLEPFAIMEGVTPTTRYRKNGKKSYKPRNPGPMRVRSGRAAGVPTTGSKILSHQSPDSRQDPTYSQQQPTPVKYCTPQVMNQPSLFPDTPDCHQQLPGSLYYSGSPFLEGWEHYADFKSVQMDDGGMVYMDEPEHYGDQYPYAWTNPQYY